VPRVYGQGDLDAAGLHVAIVVSIFNDAITRPMCEGAVQTARDHGVAPDDIEVFWVPGAFEIPQVALRLAETGVYDAIACVGAVIRGETPHFDFVAGETARAVMDVGLDTGIPVALGVITTDNLDQARARAGGSVGNKGSEAMYAALHVASLYRSITDLELDEEEEDA
jgi:6,7-dimethyl-8-ribityllumazine synthase